MSLENQIENLINHYGLTLVLEALANDLKESDLGDVARYEISKFVGQLIFQHNLKFHVEI